MSPPVCGGEKKGKLCGFSKGNQQELQEMKQIQDVAATPPRGCCVGKEETPVLGFFSKVWKT